MKVREVLERRSEWISSADYLTTKPKISVLLPTWKRAKGGFFENAVRSVLNQTFKELELIIVDDCSTDGTFDIIRRIMRQDSRVSCIRHKENIGLPALSEFEAFQKARGDYIAFIFDDNVWEQDAMETLYNYVQEKNIKAVAGQYRLFVGRPGDSYDDMSKWTTIGGKNLNIANLLIGNCFGNASVLIHREVFYKVGFYDPNLAVSRCWDWDLWIRVSKEFQFDMVDVLVGSERGCGLEDSLGNTHQLYYWAAQERMHQPRNTELLPQNYLECDIFDPTLKSSQFLYRSNYWISKQYENKSWFNPTDDALQAIEEKSMRPWNGKRIAYLTPSVIVNGSATLNWGRLPYSEKYVIFYSSLGYADYSNWILADAIIIERELAASVPEVLKWAKLMGIQVYYYIDDNFLALKEDYKKSSMAHEMERVARDTTPETIRRFEGVYCSTKELATFYRYSNLHDKLFLTRNVLTPEYVQKYHPLQNTVKIVFFGSDIRGLLLVEKVFPAIQELAKDRKIELYCPGETFERIIASAKDSDESLEETELQDLRAVDFSENLKVFGFARTLSLEMALRRLEKYELQIQIHCGPIISNNIYKTENALLNAVCLGSVLVATNDAPYNMIENDTPTCILADNTPEDWKRALLCAMDNATHKKIYQNALEYCKRTMSEAYFAGQFEKSIEQVPSCEMIDLYKRLVRHADYLRGQLLREHDANFMLRRLAQENGTSTSVQVCNSGGTISYMNNYDLLVAFYASLSSYRLTKTLNSICETRPIRKWISFFWKTQLSKPIVKDHFLSYRLLSKKKVKIVLVTNKETLVVFEYVSDNRILSQNHVIINGCQEVELDIPQSKRLVRVRIANFNDGSELHVIEKRFLKWKLLDTRR